MKTIWEFVCVFLAGLLFCNGVDSSQGCLKKLKTVEVPCVHPNGCPSCDWLFWAGYCYYFGEEPKYYESARSFCSVIFPGSRLVTIQLMAEAAYLKTEMAAKFTPSTGTIGYWNDDYSDAMTGDMIWRTDGNTIADYLLDWYPNEPAVSSDRCTVFQQNYNWKWNDVSCSNVNLAYPLCKFNISP